MIERAIARRDEFGPKFGIVTSGSALAEALSGATGILDLGCGPASPVNIFVASASYTGVEAFGPYAEAARENLRRTPLVGAARIEESKFDQLKFAAGDFSHVVLLDVIEHLSRDAGLELLALCAEWATEKIIVSTPNGFVEQGTLDGNSLQEHLSGWTVDDLTGMGFDVVGLAGPRWLHSGVHSNDWDPRITATIRYRPRLMWLLVAAALQPIVYRRPEWAFQLFGSVRPEVLRSNLNAGGTLDAP